MSKVDPMKISNVMNMFEYKGDLFEVLNPKHEKVAKGFAYFKGKFVYICKGKLKDKPVKPGRVYIKKEGELLWVKPESDEDKEVFSISRIQSISPASVVQKVNNSRDFKEVDESIVEGCEKYFTPKIKEHDDVFKRIIKRALLYKKISLRSYRTKFKNDYDISNMRYALTKDSPMSNKYLHKWAEILGLNVRLHVDLTDNDGELVHFEEELI